MKKIFFKLFVVFLINLLLTVIPSSAKANYKNIKGTQLQILKQGNSYFLVNKNTKEKVLPSSYSKIRKVKVEDKILIAADGFSHYVHLYSPNGIFDNFLKKYIEVNNYLENIKFENYPENAIIKYNKDGKSGLIIPEGDNVLITLPIYSQLVFPDGNSIASRMLNMSYSPLNNISDILKYNQKKYNCLLSNSVGIYSKCSAYHIRYKNYYIPTVIDEEVNIDNGTITVKYNKISVGNDTGGILGETYDKDFYYFSAKSYESDKKYKNITAYQNSEIKNYIKKSKSIQNIYEYINSTGNFEFKNYPETAMIEVNNILYIFDKDNVSALIFEKDKDKIYFHDSDSFISRLTGLKISFQNPDNIIFIQKGKWGIIDRYANEKVPFIYDEIYPQGSNIVENITNIEDINAQKLYVEYLGQSKDSNIFFARKGNYYGVINDKNEELVPFSDVKLIEANDYSIIKKQVEMKQKNEKNKIRKGKLKQAIIDFIFNVIVFILLPFALICPPVGYVIVLPFVL